MSYVIINKYGTKLSAFYPNDIPGVFKFSNRRYGGYITKENAKKKIDFIHKQVTDPENKQRWGEKLSNKYYRICKELQIVELED